MLKSHLIFLFSLCASVVGLHGQMPVASLNGNSTEEGSFKSWSDADLASKELTDAFRRTYVLRDGRVIGQTSRTAINYRNVHGEWAEIDVLPTKREGGVIYAEKQAYPVRLDLNSGWGQVGQIRYRALRFLGQALPVLNETEEPGVFDQPLSGWAVRRTEFKHNALKTSIHLSDLPSNVEEWSIDERLELPSGAVIVRDEEMEGLLRIEKDREVIGLVYPAWLKDAQGQYSTAGYEFKIEGTEVQLKTVLPKEWLKSPGRVFPVEIDPLVTGPTAVFGGGFMPSCDMPNFYVDSILVTVPAMITITGAFVTGSYYASPFTGATMANGAMFFSSSCGNSPQLTVAPPIGNTPGTAYLANQDYRSPLTCCLPSACTTQTFWVRMHIGRNIGGPGCNYSYVYYDMNSPWPFSVYIEGRTIETAGSGWILTPSEQCSDDCEVKIRAFARYGVPPYTIAHPWLQGVESMGNPNVGCQTPAVNKEVTATRPNCPEFCVENPNLAVPAPVVRDQCNNGIQGFSFKPLSIKPTPRITVSTNLIELCSGESAGIQFDACPDGVDVNWSGGGYQGQNQIDSIFFNNGNDTLTVVYQGTASLNGCTAAPVSATVHTYPLPSAAMVIPEVAIINTEVPLLDSSDYSGGQSQIVEWLLPGGVVVSGNPGVYSFPSVGLQDVCLVVETNYGCRDTVCKTIMIIPPDVPSPNVVTPNGDGENDALSFQYLDFFGPASLTVFNRWGIVVYSSSDYKNDWIPSVTDGTYFYELVLADGKTKTSTLLIVRP
jgi:gliding motility-associated-like protein